MNICIFVYIASNSYLVVGKVSLLSKKIYNYKL